MSAEPVNALVHYQWESGLPHYRSPGAPRTVEDLRALVGELKAGNTRQCIVRMVSNHLMIFFEQMTADDMRDYAHTIVNVILDRDGFSAFNRVKLRAIEGIITPMVKVMDMTALLLKEGKQTPAVLVHMFDCVKAFMEPFDAEMPAIYKELKRIALSRGVCAEERMRAATLSPKLIINALKSCLEVCSELEERVEVIRDPENDVALRELRDIEAEVVASLRPGNRRLGK